MSTLPVLRARIRPNKRPRPGEGEYGVGCGVLRCPGILATLEVRTFGSPETSHQIFMLEACIGAEFKEREPGHWVLGNHAARHIAHGQWLAKAGKAPSLPPRLAPRRARTRTKAFRIGDVTFDYPPVLDATERVRSFAPPVGMALDDLYVTCPECGRESVLTAWRVGIFEEEVRRRHQQQVAN
jgi:hypothetical protein